MTNSFSQNKRNRRFSVGIIGDGEIPQNSEKWDLVESVGCAVIDAGYRIVCGGLGGTMEAACKGALNSKNYYEGCTVGILPSGDMSSANRYVDIPIATSLFHGRNQIVAQSDAIVAIGGGAGTLSEMAFAWIHGRLIIGFEAGGWAEKLAGTAIDDRIRHSSIPEDKVYPAKNSAEVVQILSKYIELYTSRSD